MNLIRRHYGLKWHRRFPPVPWRLLLDAALLLSLLIGGWLVADYMATSAGLADKHAKAMYQAARAEKILIACLNNKPLIHERTAIFCNTKEIQL
ncbi:MAG: hypothetical protein Q8O37_06680 [Sulfuricellaceae bacterium]|nr:hypothetical protein [Sulfuricellaceae bacterium]